MAQIFTFPGVQAQPTIQVQDVDNVADQLARLQQQIGRAVGVAVDPVTGGRLAQGHDFVERGSVAVSDDAVQVNTSDRGSFYVQRRTIDPLDKWARRFARYQPDEVLNRISFPVEKQILTYNHNDRVMETDRYGIIRQDSGACLGVVSAKYGLVTHRQALEPALEVLSGAGFAIKHVAEKNNGAKLVIDAVNTQNEILINNDPHFPRVQLVNSYDGSTSINFKFGFYRLACLNGLMVSADDFNFSYTTRHHGGAESVVERWKQAILNEDWIEQYKMALEVLNTPIQRADAIQVLCQVFGADPEKRPDENRNVKRASHLMVYGAGQASDPTKPLTAWDVYNGVTETMREYADKSSGANEADRLLLANDRAVLAYRLLSARAA
jgi:hypothetical protein